MFYKILICFSLLIAKIVATDISYLGTVSPTRVMPTEWNYLSKDIQDKRALVGAAYNGQIPLPLPESLRLYIFSFLRKDKNCTFSKATVLARVGYQ